MLINDKTSEALDVLYGEWFNLNSLCDNAASFMLNEWAMVQANDIIHHRLCHLFPLMADDISAIKDDYDMTSIRPVVTEHKEKYTSLKEMFDTIYNAFEDTYKLISLTDDVALENGDKNVHAPLMDFMRKFNRVIGQIITLKNKAEQMPMDFDTFDFRIKDWNIVGLPELEYY